MNFAIWYICYKIFWPSVIHCQSVALYWDSFILKRDSHLQKEVEIQKTTKPLFLNLMQLKRKPHIFDTKKTSMTWSKILISQTSIPSFWSRDTRSGICYLKMWKSQVRKCQHSFTIFFFTNQDGLSFCHNVADLFETLEIVIS